MWTVRFLLDKIEMAWKHGEMTCCNGMKKWLRVERSGKSTKTKWSFTPGKFNSSPPEEKPFNPQEKKGKGSSSNFQPSIFHRQTLTYTIKKKMEISNSTSFSWKKVPGKTVESARNPFQTSIQFDKLQGTGVVHRLGEKNPIGIWWGLGAQQPPPCGDPCAQIIKIV